jgi:subtilisin family serine protease
VFAPGKEVLTLTPNGSYDFFSGSSIAAANVSGALALLLAERRHLTANQARTLLNAPSGQPHSIDLCLALTQLRKQGTCDER